MHIWSKDERPVCFEIQDMDGRRLAGLTGSWLEIVPMAHLPGTTEPTAGRPVHSLTAKPPRDSLETLGDHASFTSQNVRYSFQFAGRWFVGTAVMDVGSDSVTLMCDGQPVAADAHMDRRAS